VVPAAGALATPKRKWTDLEETDNQDGDHARYPEDWEESWDSKVGRAQEGRSDLEEDILILEHIVAGQL
jgi:hypothetical protein